MLKASLAKRNTQPRWKSQCFSAPRTHQITASPQGRIPDDTSWNPRAHPGASCSALFSLPTPSGLAVEFLMQRPTWDLCGAIRQAEISHPVRHASHRLAGLRPRMGGLSRVTPGRAALLSPSLPVPTANRSPFFSSSSSPQLVPKSTASSSPPYVPV